MLLHLCWSIWWKLIGSFVIIVLVLIFIVWVFIQVIILHFWNVVKWLVCLIHLLYIILTIFFCERVIVIFSIEMRTCCKFRRHLLSFKLLQTDGLGWRSLTSLLLTELPRRYLLWSFELLLQIFATTITHDVQKTTNFAVFIKRLVMNRLIHLSC